MWFRDRGIKNLKETIPYLVERKKINLWLGEMRICLLLEDKSSIHLNIEKIISMDPSQDLNNKDLNTQDQNTQDQDIDVQVQVHNLEWEIKILEINEFRTE